jgi:signal peptidase I
MHITYQQFEKFPMKNGFNKGDIIILTGEKFDDLKIGEIIVYQSRLAYPIIHRVVAKDDVVQTKGDHNARQITDAQLNEKYITKDQIIGKAWLKIPYLGYIKIWFSGIVNCLFTGFKTCSF